jgi:PIN domain nuclease of toxin-antitoxin system
LKLLLDTHVLLWWLDDAPMSRAAHSAIARASNIVCVSAASAWEIGLKVGLGKLRAPDDLAGRLKTERFSPLSVTIAHGLAVADLPSLHGDPFDRLLVAQARLENLTLVTRDERLAGYGVDILAA